MASNAMPSARPSPALTRPLPAVTKPGCVAEGRKLPVPTGPAVITPVAGAVTRPGTLLATAGGVVTGMRPTEPAVPVVKPTWGTERVVLIVTVVLELGIVTPAESVQGTTTVWSTVIVVYTGATAVGVALTVIYVVTVAPVAMAGLVGTYWAQIPWKKMTASDTI